MDKYVDIEISNYNYQLPDERIAKYPLSSRDKSKLLVYRSGNISHTVFDDIVNQLPNVGLMIFNNTRVIQARLYFQKSTGANIEIFCLEPYKPADYAQNFTETKSVEWLCMIGNAKKWKEGTLSKTINIRDQQIELTATRGEQCGNSHKIVFEWNGENITFSDILEHFGNLPIPPYLNRDTEEQDKQTYQTVYSKVKGSVAAPTAGLHFTSNVIEAIHKKGIKTDEVTLHVGAGTFKPVKADNVSEHEMHTEYIVVNKSTIEQIIENNCSVIAVGTTSVRTIESLYHIGVKLLQRDIQDEVSLSVTQWQPYENKNNISAEDSLKAIISYMENNHIEQLKTSTQIIIAPSYEYKIVKAIVTNFHQPQSTLLLLVSAFVGSDWEKIYKYALNNDFRFLSYGDSSLLIP